MIFYIRIPGYQSLVSLVTIRPSYCCVVQLSDEAGADSSELTELRIKAILSSANEEGIQPCSATSFQCLGANEIGV
jgi:hypothetical protein